MIGARCIVADNAVSAGNRSQASAVFAMTIGMFLSVATRVEAMPIEFQITDTHGAAVADAVVILDPLDASPAPSHSSAVIDQVNKAFVPHVSVVRTGTSISFPNSDHIRHQVYSFSPAKTFTIKLYAGSPKETISVEASGLIVLGCNIHDSMAGFLAVVDTPYFGKSTPEGTLRIDAPNGRYRLRVWHERLIQPFASESISVAAAGLRLPLKLNIVAGSAVPAAWPE
jgi:plastocyanin